MKNYLASWSAGALLLVFASGAWAACPTGTALTSTQITALLSANTICAASGSDVWQEQHRAGGQLWDYKRGPGHATDPTAQVGTWTINAGSRTSPAGTVTHNYGGASVYTYNVFGTGVVGSSHNFCNAVTSVVGTVKPGQSSCP